MSRPVITAAPVASLNMEEVKFWLEIMRDHALFIKLGLPADNVGLINEAESFFKEFSSLINRASKVCNEKQFARLVADSLDAVAEFLRFKRHLLQQMIICKVSGNNPPLMLDHMAREAEYVLALFGRIKNQVKNPHLSKTRENVFWLRVMSDHTKFIIGRLDPSERVILHRVNNFSNEFEDLFLEANDFYSMLTHPGQLPLPAIDKKVKKSCGVLPHLDPPAYNRFIQDVRSSVLCLRDFKKALYNMIVDCRVVSIIPPLLADHMRREADHFLMVLAMMEKDLIGVTGDYAEPMEGMLTENSLGACDSIPEELKCPYDLDEEDDDDDLLFVGNEQEGTEDDEYEDDCEYDSDYDCDYDSDDDERETIPAQPKQAADLEGKIKWSGKWPRPLGRIKDR